MVLRAVLTAHLHSENTRIQAAMDLFKQLSDGVKAGVDMTQGAVKGAVDLSKQGIDGAMDLTSKGTDMVAGPLGDVANATVHEDSWCRCCQGGR